MTLLQILEKYNDLTKSEISKMIEEETGIHSKKLIEYVYIENKLEITLNEIHKFRLKMIYKSVTENVYLGGGDGGEEE
jgi:hypothetical protein